MAASATEEDKERSDKTDAEPDTTVATIEEEGGLFGGLMGIFDGPSDYGRSPYSQPECTFGHWDWPRQPPSYAQQDGYGMNRGETSTEHGHWSSRCGPNHNRPGEAHSFYRGYEGLTAHNTHPPRFEKRVHFDYGQPQEPPADHARHADGYEGSGTRGNNPYMSPRSFYRPSLSSWSRPHPGWYGERPHKDNHGFQSHHPHGYRQESNECGPHPAQHHAPAPPPLFTHQPPPVQFPAPAPGRPPHIQHPSPGFPPPWVTPQHLTPWPPHPAFGMPEIPRQGYFPPYTPYAPTPYAPNVAAGNSNDQKSCSGPNQNATTPKPGSLDPAKDENNRKGDGWDNNKTSEADRNGNTENQGDWTNDHTSDASGDGWKNDDDTNNNQNDTANWTNDANQKNDGTWDNNNDQGSGNNTWENAGANQGQSSKWENSNQGANTQNHSGKRASNATSNSAQPSAGSGVRPLYGPYGAYYAVQSSAADVACDAEEEPPYDVPQSYVDSTGSSKQVQPGRGYLYCKKQCRPQYVDELSEPYARFVFIYRTKEEMRKELGVEIDTEPSGNEEVQAFQNMDKDDLIQILLRAKGALGRQDPIPSTSGG
jgi:hypothetical protein